jgi:hypothetical protein
MVNKKKQKRKRILRVVKNPWFMKMPGSKRHEWGFIPINWKGAIALTLLIGINIFAANYFNLNILSFDNWSKFGVVFLLSFFVFIEIAMRKTRREKDDKKK